MADNNNLGMIGAGALGVISDIATGGANRKFAEKSAKQQYNYQRQLNEQGQQLALDTWNKTNYGAQRKHLEDAGLNAGLLYGQSGGGGATTNSGSGGSVGMAQATQQNTGTNEAMGSAVQIGLMEAQKENIEADTVLKEKDAGNKGADTVLKGQQALESDTSRSARMERIATEAQDAVMKLQLNENDASVSTNVINDRIKQIRNEAIGSGIDNVLKEADINLRYGQEKEIKARIQKMSEDIAQGWEALDQNRQKIEIEKFTRELQSEYPNLMNVGGKLINEIVNGTQKIIQMTTGRKAGENFRKMK